MTVTSMKPTPDEQEQTGRSRRKVVLAAVVGLLVVAVAGWYFLLRPSGPAEPVPGEVMVLEPVQLNLSGGHYLRIGLGLQLSEDAHETDGSKALDATIRIFSGLEVAEVSRSEQREELRETLMSELDDAYHGDVLEVYFTEFVTQ